MTKSIILNIILIALICGCADSKSNNKSKNSILPFSLTLHGLYRDIEDVQSSVPPIHFEIREDSIKIIVGKTESYKLSFQETSFDDIIKLFKVEDFKSNEYYSNKHLYPSGVIITKKNIDNQLYEKKYYGYKRGDMELNYLPLDSEQMNKSHLLYNHAKEIALSFLKDKVNKDTMTSVSSMKEALVNPEKVYELSLRNSRTSELFQEIGKLINLRILNISGSRIKSIPPEIEKCKNLKSIIANASQLENIPSTIKNLKKLRVINFGYCKIKEVPNELGELDNLWSLHLGANKIQDLPESISNLKNVTFFSIENNHLKEFPKQVLGLESVLNLWMHKNDFKSIPIEIQQLESMSHLLVDVHEIENIEEIYKLIPDVRIIDQEKR